MQTIQFHQDTLYVGASAEGVPLVAVRPICDALGVAFSAQHHKLANDPRFSCHDIVMTGADGKNYGMFCIPVEQLNGWLFTINANKVKPESRGPLLKYQQECMRVLFKHFMPRGITVKELHNLLAVQAGLSQAVSANSELVSGLGTRIERLEAIVEPLAEVFGENAGKSLAAVKKWQNNN